jgi:choline monooxygenase
LAPVGLNKRKVYEYGDALRFAVSNDALNVHLLPDIGFLFLPGPDLLTVFITAPDGPEGCHELMQYFTLDGKVGADVKPVIDYFSFQLGPEDNELCERVQRGLRSRGYRGGRLMVDAGRTGISEHAVERFHTQIMTTLRA